MKQIRKPAPYPPPDEELCEHFGRTMYYAQKLEKEFKLFLLTNEALGKIKVNKRDFKDVEGFLLKQNLGDLINTLRNGNGLSDRNLKHLLDQARQDRNKLAHAIFANIEPDQITLRQKQKLLRELGRIRLSVGNAFLVMREFRKIAEEEIGITEEQIRQKLDSWETNE
ncbi:MAG TPA: hypothetical protein VN887_09430 [Candidatus Angelobacter sp.]|nr:hypothetical protein [Candidatus Angelobacter sp.]